MPIKSLTFIYLIVEEREETTEYRLKMYYYPIKANDSRPNPNPIFIMSEPARVQCVWIIFNVALIGKSRNDDLKHERQ